LLATRAAATAATVAALAVAWAGCGSGGSGIQSGEHVTVYVSMPLRGPEGRDGRDVVDGARLALHDARGRVGPLTVRAAFLDDTGGRAPNARWSPATTAENARRATQDSTAIAYIGDLDSGATRFSLPITNEARMLQVSPTSSAIDLVQPYLDAGDQIPNETQPTGERTFGRVIPSDEVQAEAGAAWARRLGFRRVATISDGSLFGDTMVEAFRAAASGITPAAPGASRLVYYGGTAADAPAAVARDLASCSRRTLLATDALIGSRLLGRVPAGASACPGIPAGALAPAGVLITSAAQDPSQLPAAGQRFVRAFRSRYRRSPGRYAAYGYEAMAVVLDSIRRAGASGDERDAIVNAFFDTRDRHSILGTYSIDDVGDTTLDRLAGYRVRAGRLTLAASLNGS
jgi:branched-chain amino acid transport system substrate-binding protein